jgi:hypothetical protein
MSILAFVSDQHSISRILDHLGLRSPQLDRPHPVGEIREITRVAEAGEGWGVRPAGTEATPPPLPLAAPEPRDGSASKAVGCTLGLLGRATPRRPPPQDAPALASSHPTWAAEPISTHQTHQPHIKTPMDPMDLWIYG